MLIVTPLTFLGGAFYSIDMLPPAWRTFSLFNPIVYLISGFRWSFYGTADVSVGVSLGMTLGFFALCLAGSCPGSFKTGYRLKNFLHMKNWQALGEPNKATSAKVWFVLSLVVLGGFSCASVLGPYSQQQTGSVRIVGFLLLIAWYFGWCSRSGFVP
jgi:hypothetical protein